MSHSRITSDGSKRTDSGGFFRVTSLVHLGIDAHTP